MGNWLLQLVRTIVRELGAFVIALIEALARGLGNLLIRFFSSQFGIGASIFGIGYWFSSQGKEDAGVWLGLLGLAIAFLSFKKGK